MLYWQAADHICLCTYVIVGYDVAGVQITSASYDASSEDEALLMAERDDAGKRNITRYESLGIVTPEELREDPPFTIGQRVRIHPACDWFMRGAKYGTITSLRSSFAYVKLENIGPRRLRARIAYTLLMIA